MGTEDGQDRGGARDELHGHAPEDAPPQAAGAQHFAMDAGRTMEEAPAAGRPAPLLEVRPQEGLRRHTGVGFELLLDPVVPQLRRKLVEVPTVVSLVVSGIVEIGRLGSSLTLLTSSRSAVLRRVRGGASASIHRQSGGYFSCSTETGFTVQTVPNTVQTVPKTGDSMVHFWMVVDMHVAVQMTRLWSRQCKTAVFRSCSSLTRLSMSLLLQFIDKASL